MKSKKKHQKVHLKMIENRFLRFSAVVLLFFIRINLWAQVGYSEHVPRVDQSGYYRIALSQEMIGVAVENDFKGIRLKDQKGKEISYFIDHSKIVDSISSFVDLKSIKISTDKKNSFAIVENSKEIETLYVQIKSVDVGGKQIRVRGSHDMKQWYLVKSKTAVSAVAEHFNANDEVFEIRFPKGKYSYYEVMMTNNQEQPIEILSIKTREKSKEVQADWLMLDLGKTELIDSVDNKTYLRFPEIKHQYFIGKLEFDIAFPQYYQRKASVEGIHFLLSSKNSEIVLDKNVVINKKSLFIIHNENNEALQLQKLKAYGKPVYLCAYLTKNEQISVELEVSETTMPNYDIVYFKKDIPKELIMLNTTDFHSISKVVSSSRTERWFESKVLMWLVLIAIGGFLLWICFRLASDIQKR